MKNLLRGGALALPLLTCVSPGLAQDASDDITVTATRSDTFGPAGTMGDHVHDKGTFMIGLEWQRSDHGGTNLSGSDEISDIAIADAGYGARTQSMTMDMAMLHLMYAPDDRLTFMVMPMWMRMKMTMVGVGAPMDDHMGGMDMGGMDMGHGHHMLAPGETMTHSTEGFGDTEVGALYALANRPELGVIAGMAVSIPTGKIDRENADGTFVHYGMQSGSGTWDLVPSVTLKGAGEHFSWGLQGRYRLRTGEANDSGFKFGDVFSANAWVALPVTRAFSVSGRLGYRDEGDIEGHYNGPHNHHSPPDRQENYGGQVVDAGLGANVALGTKWRVGGELNVPIHQDLNGIQAPRNWGLNLSLTTIL